MFELSIIIVTFNSEKHIAKCINSIENNRINNKKIRIIIIDNSSSDKTVQIVKNIRKGNPKIVFKENKDNIGFAKAVNQGIKKYYKQCKYVLLLNPDTVLKNKSLLKLIECSGKHKAQICGGNTIDVYGKETGSYFRFPNIMVGLFDFTNLRKIFSSDKWHKYFYYKDSSEHKGCSFPVDVVTGGFMLIRTEIISKVGFFDERFFMYLEDVDFCLRAKRMGLNIYHTNNSEIIHIGGASSNNKDKIKHTSWLLSRKLYFIKHFGFFTNLLIQPLFVIDDLIILSMYILKRENLNH